MPLLAGLFGAGIALLFAPRSGRETRAQLKTRGQDMKRTASDNMADLRDVLERKIQEGKQMKQRVSKALSETTDKAEEEISEIRKEQGETPLATWKEEA